MSYIIILNLRKKEVQQVPGLYSLACIVNNIKARTRDSSTQHQTKEPGGGQRQPGPINRSFAYIRVVCFDAEMKI